MESPTIFTGRLRKVALAIITSSALLAGCGSNAEGDAEQAQIHVKSSQAYRDQGQYRAAMIEARNALQLAPQNVPAALSLASIYLELGDGKAAAELLERVDKSQSAKAAVPLASAYLDMGKFSSAEETLATADLSNEQRQSAEFLVAKARIAGKQQRLDEAEALLRQAINNHPDDVTAPAALVELVLMRDGAEQALKVAEEVLQRHRDKPDAQFVYAEIAGANQDMEGIERHLTNALSRLPQTDVITPLKARVLRHLSSVLTQQGRTTEALVYTRLLAEANPEAQEMRQQYDDAVTQLRAGKLNEAEQTLTSMYERNPGNDTSALFLGLVNLQKGELDQAIELFDEHLDPETASPQMIRAASLAQLQKNRPEEALRILRKAKDDRPNDAGVLAVFGLTALNIAGAEEEGVLALQNALEQDPSKAELRIALAEYYARQGRAEQALEQLETAAGAAPSNFAVQRAYVSALLQQGNIPKARSVTDDLQQSAGEAFFTWLLSAQVNLAAQDYSPALQQLNKAAALAPREPAPLIGLAQLALQQREWGNAARYFERAAGLRGDLVPAYKGIVTAHESAGTIKEGLAHLEKLAEDPSKAPTANAVIAQYYLLNEQPQKSETFVEKALETETSPTRYLRGVAAQTYRALAAQARSRGESDAAREHLMAALRQIPNSLALTRELAALEIQAGRYEEAHQLLDAMAATPGGRSTAALLRAAMLHQQKKPAEAAELLTSEWQAQPHADIANQRYLLAKQGRQGSVEEILQEWRRRFPLDARPLVYLGMEAQEAKQTDAATSYYEQALTINPNNPLALNNLAWIRFEAGEREAVELAKRAADLAPNNGAILDTYGWILVQKGDKTEGIKWLEKAAQAAPGSTEIQQHLEQARSS